MGRIGSRSSCSTDATRAKSILGSGGRIAVKELRLDTNRTGPATGLYFALNLALYTRSGDLADDTTTLSWLNAAQFEDVSIEPMDSEADAPDAVVYLGRAPL